MLLKSGKTTQYLPPTLQKQHALKAHDSLVCLVQTIWACISFTFFGGRLNIGLCAVSDNRG